MEAGYDVLRGCEIVTSGSKVFIHFQYVVAQEKEIKKLESIIQKQKEALEFYATNAKFIDGYDKDDESPVLMGGKKKFKAWIFGKRARQTLKEVEEMMKEKV